MGTDISNHLTTANLNGCIGPLALLNAAGDGCVANSAACGSGKKGDYITRKCTDTCTASQNQDDATRKLCHAQISIPDGRYIGI